MKQFKVRHDGGDGWEIIDRQTDEVCMVQRFGRADQSLKAQCDCGDVDDRAAESSPCLHIIAVDAAVFQNNSQWNGDTFSLCATTLEETYNIRVNAPEPEIAKPPCDFHNVKRCAAIAADHGLSFAHKEGRRAAAGEVVGHFVESCKELSGEQWDAMADEIRDWGLRWDETSAFYDTKAGGV